MNDWASAARKFVRASQGGSLATHSQSHPGYPFASVASFVPDEVARPVLLVSPLAEHSRNLDSDVRASLMVQQPSSDMQAAARVTVMGDVERFHADEAFVERYVRYQPQAERLLGLGDFYFVRLNPRAIRFIGGFGAIRWVSPKDYQPRWCPDARAESELLRDLRTKHRQLIESVTAKRHANRGAALECVGLDCDGLQLWNGALTRIEIDPPATGFESLIDGLERIAA